MSVIIVILEDQIHQVLMGDVDSTYITTGVGRYTHPATEFQPPCIPTPCAPTLETAWLDLLQGKSPRLGSLRVASTG